MIRFGVRCRGQLRTDDCRHSTNARLERGLQLCLLSASIAVPQCCISFAGRRGRSQRLVICMHAYRAYPFPDLCICLCIEWCWCWSGRTRLEFQRWTWCGLKRKLEFTRSRTLAFSLSFPRACTRTFALTCTFGRGQQQQRRARQQSITYLHIYQQRSAFIIQNNVNGHGRR